MESRDGTMWLSQEQYPTTGALQGRLTQFFEEHSDRYPVTITKYADVLWQTRMPLVQLMEGLPSTLRHYLCDSFVVRDIASFVSGQEEEEEAKEAKEEEAKEQEPPYVCKFDMVFPEYTNTNHAGHHHHANVRRRLCLLLAEERHSILLQNNVYQVHGLQFVWRDKQGTGLPDGFYDFRRQLYDYLRS